MIPSPHNIDFAVNGTVIHCIFSRRFYTLFVRRRSGAPTRPEPDLFFLLTIFHRPTPGDGVTPETARRWLDAGASHVIVTSAIFARRRRARLFPLRPDFLCFVSTPKK